MPIPIDPAQPIWLATYYCAQSHSMQSAAAPNEVRLRPRFLGQESKRELQMNKIDLKKKYKHLYLPSAKKAEVVEVPSFSFVTLWLSLHAEVHIQASRDKPHRFHRHGIGRVVVERIRQIRCRE